MSLSLTSTVANLPSVDAEAFADIEWSLPATAPPPRAAASAVKPRLVQNAPNQVVRQLYALAARGDGVKRPEETFAAGGEMDDDSPPPQLKRRRV